MQRPQRSGPKGLRQASGAGWFEKRKAGNRGVKLLAQIGRRCWNEIGRRRKHDQLLRGDVRKTVMAGQQMLGNVRRRRPVHAHDRHRAINAVDIQVTSRTMKQRKQQSDGHQQHQRQPAKPTSDFQVCYHAAKLRHRRASEPLSPVNFKAPLKQLRLNIITNPRLVRCMLEPKATAPSTCSSASATTILDLVVAVKAAAMRCRYWHIASLRCAACCLPCNCNYGFSRSRNAQ